MNSFWHWWILLLTAICMVFVVGILFGTRKAQRKTLTEEKTGHCYDGIEEYDNPLPHWWFRMFVITIVFSAGYLLLYPGLGRWQGLWGWTSTGELEKDQKKHVRRYAPEFARYAATPVDKLIENPKALKLGERIFANNCAACHGSDGGGYFGFPDLTDTDWLYGGSFEAIKETIIHGRQGQMPAWGSVIGEMGVKQVASYVRTLSGLSTTASEDELRAGKQIFQSTCSVCHNENGTGNQALGAPNLTNNIWLYGSSQAQIEYTLRKGRNGVMPAWIDILGSEKVHLVSAYVYSLSRMSSN